MNENHRNHKNPIEINDLIGDAVENAITRRNASLYSEDDFSNLSEEEAANIAGGLTSLKLIPPITAGIFPVPQDEFLA
ncbi:MAG: hypothetical protein KME21_05915 [Desmonostoc vinosum HA7617-LM4]|jgi:hypothetical protein|nr:hypothetical protein [Desmonostoc vinosum HA7617-LM4]